MRSSPHTGPSAAPAPAPQPRGGVGAAPPPRGDAATAPHPHDGGAAAARPHDGGLPERATPRLLRRARRALPFVLAAALVAFTLGRLDGSKFLAALARVDAPLFLGFAVLFVLALLAADTFATVLVYRRAVAPVAFRDFLVLRGASYLPSLLNHHVGQAFITVFLSRVHGVPLARVAGATLVVYASWLGCLLALGAVAFPANGASLGWSALLLGIGGLYLALLALRPARLARARLLAPLFEAGVRGHLLALAARLPHLVVLFAGTWLPFWFFGVRIPVGAALTYIPILMVAVTLPLTPQGFGTRDVLAAALFERFAAGATREERLAAIAASTTAWAVAITLVEAALGLALLRVALPGEKSKDHSELSREAA
ncbi:lysylphosphatidylglycerol synthase domain-containing protein [Sorangium cellulosum]|uniref:lysylphosphatidylglycerol synthase domain-containing protein n=1 Tax=Sorangium cellulosum TaxID=56 RepID=UPI001F26B281|nr:lysylphosphatidylglycerol synthase domain-containing protein [Sorangium cellulosum]